MAQHARPVALPGAPHRAGSQGHRPGAPRGRAVSVKSRPRAGAGRRGRDALQRPVGIAPGARPRPQLTMYLDPSRCCSVRLRSARCCWKAPRSLVERNEAGDANLEMLPPPDGSGPHAGENRSLRIRANPAFPWINTIEVRDSVLTVSEGAGRPPVVLNVARGSFKATAPNQPLQIDARLSRAAGDAARADRDDRIVRRLDAGLAGQHRCAGRLRRRQDRDQGQHRHQGHRFAGHERGPECRGLRSLSPPAAAVGRSLCAEREGRDPAQRPQGRGAVAQGRGVRAEPARRCFAPIAAARRSSR